jgi:hypothetical protein
MLEKSLGGGVHGCFMNVYLLLTRAKTIVLSSKVFVPGTPEQDSVLWGQLIASYVYATNNKGQNMPLWPHGMFALLTALAGCPEHFPRPPLPKPSGDTGDTPTPSPPHAGLDGSGGGLASLREARGSSSGNANVSLLKKRHYGMDTWALNARKYGERVSDSPEWHARYSGPHVFVNETRLFEEAVAPVVALPVPDTACAERILSPFTVEDDTVGACVRVKLREYTLCVRLSLSLSAMCYIYCVLCCVVLGTASYCGRYDGRRIEAVVFMPFGKCVGYEDSIRLSPHHR